MYNYLLIKAEADTDDYLVPKWGINYFVWVGR